MSLNLPVALAVLLAVPTLRACDPGTSSSSTGGEPAAIDELPEISMDCDRLAGDPVDIDYAFVEGGDLIVGVGYSGGCVEDHAFEACWGGDWIKTYPMKVGLDLVHDARGDTCRAYILEELSFSLAPVYEETEAAFPGQEGVWILIGDETTWFAF